MTLTGKFVWFECNTPDPAKAQAFYSEVLGWKIENFDMGPSKYPMAKVGDAGVGGFVQNPDARTPAHWLSYVAVENVDATADKLKAAGGKVLVAPANIPTVGRSAKVADPQGAVFHLFTPAPGGPERPDEDAKPGQFTWNELSTPDPKKAVAFYENLIGYTHKAMDMGPGGTYYVLESGGKGRGGVTAPMKKEIPPMWLPYVAVADCDATVARARKQGGAVHFEPTDIPNIGRFAIISDPTGATLGVIKETR